MIIFKTGDLLQSKCEVLVNTVNCVGVMGKGIALQFKTKYPDMFTEYVKACKRKDIQIGKLWLWHEPKQLFTDTHSVLCFPTKEHWKNASKIEWIERGLQCFLLLYYKQLNITSIAFPKLGCANGGLNWQHDVKPLMLKYLNNLNITIEIYE